MAGVLGAAAVTAAGTADATGAVAGAACNAGLADAVAAAVAGKAFCAITLWLIMPHANNNSVTRLGAKTKGVRFSDRFSAPMLSRAELGCMVCGLEVWFNFFMIFTFGTFGSRLSPKAPIKTSPQS